MRRWTAGLILLLAASLSAAAEDPDRVLRETEVLARETAILRVFAAIRLTPSQAGRLAPPLQQAQTRLQEADRSEAAAIARLAPEADAARARAISGRVPAAAVERKLADAIRTSTSARRRLRAELVTVLRGHLERILTRDQLEALRSASEELQLQERRSDLVAEAESGERGGGPVGWMGRRLDRLRAMPQERWERIRDRREGRRPSRFRTPEELEELDGDDPLIQLGDELRAMTPEEYQVRRNEIALDLLERRAQEGPRPPAAAGDRDAGLDRFIERYLLHPAAASAARRKAGIAPPAGEGR